jgi:hypothetical protein
MLETYNTLLTDVSRNLYRNARDSPILYSWFGFMLIFSLLMMAVLTLFILKTEIEISLKDVFFAVFFVALMKSSVDFHKYFIKSPVLSYALSTQAPHKRTVFEIFLMVFWVQLGLWVVFSSLYSIFLIGVGIPLGYPVEYITFTMGVMLASVLGTLVALHFFSTKRYRLVPVGGLIVGLWFFNDPVFIFIILMLSGCYLAWSFTRALDSYQYVPRKERKNERDQVRIYDAVKAIFHKEITVMWRDKILMSFIFTAVSLGILSGYLAVFGNELLIPENLRELTEQFSPTIYAFLGVYVVTIYTAVFSSLNLFLNEENTMWILRNLPISEKTMVHGKLLALSLPLLASIPFVAYFVAFTGVESLMFTLWFLVFAFIVGIAVALPLGAKYMGKKSDVLLLYSVAMIVFVILAFAVAVENLVVQFSASLLLYYLLSILIVLGFMILSVELSTRIVSLNYMLPVERML